MGEQTQTQIQTQTQTQTHAHTHSQTQFQTQPQPLLVQARTQPQHDTTAAPQTQSSAELANVPPQTAPPPSKISLRPRKIRKLSPETAAEPNSSDNSTAGTTPSKPTSRATKAKTNTPRAIVFPRYAARSLSCEGELEIAIRHLRDADPLLASLIDIHPPPTLDTFNSPFLALTRSILYQQLAFKAGTSIYTRFIALCGSEAGVLPDTVLALTPLQLRQIGVSGRKASYLHDLAKKYKNGILSDSAILNMDDKSLFTMLTMVNGIGSWSVHMFMIFSLHRPDVLPINDLGVRKGVQLLYNLEELPRPSQMDQLCEKWRPYRSVASWYLRRFVETKGTPSSAAAVAAGAGMQLQQQDLQHHQQQPQLIDPINSILNLGACNWGPQ
ncbi:putative DNA-3-methyladenine glycosylase [Tripterygium wilfordii]|uniref:Putative DNA-3-methyladenine glycosylase n=1 Tax=Tripterygium wilfordii TaxID=458696 RepID=A0A7J7D350_TRIWF|nr:probable DNA-3-methyladenine glycosylase 2 isoform X2 [Tripterygium wilfordii]KAF5740775.1 putative DNA-3-methyladenine glycosylase [Tripterygium wilfordii]